MNTNFYPVEVLVRTTVYIHQKQKQICMIFNRDHL